MLPSNEVHGSPHLIKKDGTNDLFTQREPKRKKLNRGRTVLASGKSVQPTLY